MESADHYAENNSMQKHNAQQVLEKYLPLINWRRNENILDIGSGDGSVLFDLLYPKLPNDFQKLVAADSCEDMVRFVKTKYNGYPKVEVLNLDISKEIPKELSDHFDHIFSFYCFHWVVDQRQVLQNTFNLLKPGGQILVSVAVNHPVFDTHAAIANTERWAKFAPYLTDYITPYRYFEHPSRDMGNLLESVGFRDCKCEVVELSYKYSGWEAFWEWFSPVNAFLKYVSESEYNSYKNEFIEITKKNECVTNEEVDGEVEITMTNKLLAVIASKPI